MKTTPPLFAAPTPLALFLLFSKIGLTSFGGGLSGWLMREIVTKRQWMSQADFLSGLALSQALPGLNVVNLSIWIGFRLGGRNGALAASSGMVLPPLILALVLFSIYEIFSNNTQVSVVMAGIAAAAIGLSLEMAIRTTRYASQNILFILVIVGIFVSITLLDWSLVAVVLVAAPVSIGIAWFRLKGK